MKKLSIIILVFIYVNSYSQVKKGGFFSRIDDPIMATRTANLTDALNLHDTIVSQCYKYNLHPTFAVVSEYSQGDYYVNEPYMKFFPEKLEALQEYLDSGHYLSMHSPNHSTNYYISHVDSLSSEDQLLISSGYSDSDGVDTIVINDTDSQLDFWYWKRLPDDHYGWFALDKMIDNDNLDDSIYYHRTIPPRSVYVSIYHGEAGLIKIINEQRRRFTMSGLDEPIMFIHPGQETYYREADTLTETTGYIQSYDDDTVLYYVQEIYSSQIKPIADYDSLVIFEGSSHMVDYVSGSNSPYTLVLNGYTGDASTHDCKVKPIRAGNWMWWVSGDVMNYVAENLNLRITAIYENGRQYDYIGVTPSITNKAYFKYAQQWGQILDGNYASSNIASIAEATSKNYFVSTNDHKYLLGGYEYIDSVYNFINNNLSSIVKCSMYDLPDSLYNISSPYENIVPSFDTDIDENNEQDGWSKSNEAVWTKGGINIEGDTTYMTVVQSTTVNCFPLWGVEKGNNVLSVYISNDNASSVQIIITEYKHRLGTDTDIDVVDIDTITITNLTSNYCERFRKVHISEQTDFIKLDFRAIGGNYYAIKPKIIKYTAGRNYY